MENHSETKVCSLIKLNLSQENKRFPQVFFFCENVVDKYCSYEIGRKAINLIGHLIIMVLEPFFFFQSLLRNSNYCIYGKVQIPYSVGLK